MTRSGLRIDLQVHTYHSDGGKSPEDLIMRAHTPSEAIGCLALLDHDGKEWFRNPGLTRVINGVSGILQRVKDIAFRRGKLRTQCRAIPRDVMDVDTGDAWPLLRYDTFEHVFHTEVMRSMYVVQACEISAMYEGRQVDVLGYFMPGQDDYFDNVFESQIKPRRERAMRMVEEIAQAYDWNFSMQDVYRVLGPAKKIMSPHIALALLRKAERKEIELSKKLLLERRVARGEPESTGDYRTDDILDVYVKPHDSPENKLPKGVIPSLEDVVRNLLAIKAIPVVPWSRRLGVAGLRQIIGLVHEISNGYFGLEVVNRRYAEATVPMVELANDFNVTVRTAGSDYHGQDRDPPDRNYFGVRLEGEVPQDVLERLIKCRMRLLNE